MPPIFGRLRSAGKQEMNKSETNTDTVRRVLDTCGIGYSLKDFGDTVLFFCRTHEGRRFNIRTDGEAFRIWKYVAMGVSGEMWVKLMELFGDVLTAMPQMKMELNEDLDVSWYCEAQQSDPQQLGETLKQFTTAVESYWQRLS